MLVLAQQVTVNVPPDQVGRVVSVAAVAIALGSLIWSWRQGRAIRNIQTTQHDWETVDRISAWVEVVGRISEPQTLYMNGKPTGQYWSRTIVLTNTGRSARTRCSLVRW